MASKFDVVISGMSGRFPECDDVHTFQQRLYNLENFITVDNRRWPVGYKYKLGEHVVPCGTGKYTNDSIFDFAVFNFTTKFSNTTDAINRKVLEPAFEAIVDAGINPYTLQGRNIGVFTTTGTNEMEINMFQKDSSHLLGIAKTMQANRISYTFNFVGNYDLASEDRLPMNEKIKSTFLETFTHYCDYLGPSCTCYDDLKGSLQVVSTACRLMSEGTIEAALVGGSSHILGPALSLQYVGLNLLSPDGLCRAFDKHGNGFGRSEATVMLFLQRAEDAKRNYGSIVLCDTFYYGCQSSTLIGYNESIVKDYLRHIYHQENTKELMAELQFVELSACGIQRTDAIESNAIADVLCKDRKKPLLVGSITSNMGNSDATTPYLSLMKAIFALNTETVAPNANFTEPNEKIEALRNKTLQVVDKPTKFTGNLVGVNVMGLTSTFGHVLIRQNNKVKKPEENRQELPRLLLICGRTEEGLQNAIKEIEARPYNKEFISLINDVFQSDMPFHIHRGYTILPKRLNTRNEIGKRGDRTRPVWFIFSGMGSQWNGMGEGLLDIPIFADVVKKCDQILKPKGIDVYTILTSMDPTIFDNIIHSFVGIITIQIGLVEILRALKISPDGIIGHSLGENACAYADNCLTLEQAVLASYERGKASVDAKTIKGMMAAVGKGNKDIKDFLPKDLAIACHNSPESCTLSGPANLLNKFVEKLQKAGVFAKSVNVANIAYHSKYIAPLAPQLLSSLKKIIPNPSKRSSKWISTSLPESKWDTPSALYCSAEYLTNNLLSSVFFEEACKSIPSEAILIEIAPHGLLQAILKRSSDLKTCTHVPLTLRSTTKNNLNFLLSAIGKLYLAGCEPAVNELFPKISYPVHKSTPSISPFCTWDKYEDAGSRKVYRTIPDPPVSAEAIPIHINADAEYNYLKYHKIKGQEVIPAAFFMYLVWDFLSKSRNEKLGTLSVTFEDVIIHKNPEISTEKPKFVFILIQISGSFEVQLQDEENSEETTVVISGIIITHEEPRNSKINSIQKSLDKLDVQLNQQQIYDIFREIGYELDNCFTSIKRICYNNTECIGEISWAENWVSLLDSLIKFHMLTEIRENSEHVHPSFIRRLSICCRQFTNFPKGATIACYKNLMTSTLNGEGVEMEGLEYEIRTLSHDSARLKLAAYEFVSYMNPKCKTSEGFVELCLQIAIGNLPILPKTDGTKLYIIERTNTCSENIAVILRRNSNLRTKATVLSMTEIESRRLKVQNKCLLLVTSNINDVLTCADMDCTFILVVTAAIEFSDEFLKAYTTITEQKFSNLMYTLLKKKSTLKFQILNGDSKNSYNTGEINKSKDQPPNFILKRSTDSKNLSILLSKHKRGDQNRYLFVLDNSVESPKYESLIQSQVNQDLPVSILRSEEWGFYRNIAYSYSELSPANIQLKSVEVQYLCSYPEASISQTSKDNNYGIEYAGIHNSGTKVMGLALVNMSKPISEVDPILTWQIPKDWSLQNAATLPFIYAQAYYISSLFDNKVKESLIFINMGDQRLLAEACMSIWLPQGGSIFICVPSVEEAQLIRTKFPMLEDFRILHGTKYAYEKHVSSITEGRGVDVFVNFAVDVNDITESFSCLGSFSYYIAVGDGNWSRAHDLGLFSFLKKMSFITTSNKVSKLLNLSAGEKRTLQNNVEAGIVQGIVTPFPHIELQGDRTEYNSQDQGIKKVHRHQQENEITNSRSQKLHLDRNHSYIIVGQQKNKEWFQVIEWLMSKGAFKFLIILDNVTCGPQLSSRLKRAMNQNECTISFVSSENIDTVDGATKIIMNAQRIAPVEALFFISLDHLGSKMQIMDIASREVNPNMHFISLFSGGLQECEERRYKGSPALVIHCDDHQVNMSSVLSEVSHMLMDSDSNNLPTLFEIPKDELPSELRRPIPKLSDFLPKDMNILANLGSRVTEKSGFEETSTLSPRYSNTNGVYPIFVIPSTHENKLQPILRKLVYPAFYATVGCSADSTADIASELYVSLNRIQPTGPVTLIGETWSANLAIELAMLFQQNGRKHRLFLLEGNPRQWKQCIESLGSTASPEFQTNLVEEIFSFDPQVHGKIIKRSSNETFSEQVEHYLSTLNLDADIRQCTMKAAILLRKRIILACQHTDENLLLKHTTLFKRHSFTELPLNLSVTSEIKTVEADSYEDFIVHPQIIDEINSKAAFIWWEYTKVKC